MKKIILVLSLLIASSAYAGNEIDVCNGCKIYYSTPRRVVVKKTVTRQVPVPVAVPVAPAPMPVPVAVPVAPIQQPVAVQYYPAGPGPITSTMMVPVAVPVAPPPRVCAWYIDPYDLFGQLFGNPDLVQSCW